jgi:transposase InsO family protein
VSERHVRSIARREGWRIQDEGGNGGRHLLFHRLDVLAYKARRSGTPPVFLVTADPTPEFSLPADNAAWMSVPDHGRQVASQRLQAVEAWEAYRRAGGDVEAFAAAWNPTHPDLQVTRSTLYRWVAEHRQGGIAALVPGTCLRDQKGQTIPDELREYFDHLYLDQSRRTVRLCWSMTQEVARAKGLVMPSLQTFYRHAEQLPQASVVLAREGKKAWEDKASPFIRRGYTEVCSNAIWVADHHQVDIAVRGPDGRPHFPWLTVFQDIRSRAWVGWHVSLNPNSDTIFMAFQRGVKRFGLPEKLSLDNGKDFRSQDFAGGRPRTVKVEQLDDVRTRSLTARLDIKVTFARPYNARSKPIERSFLTLKGWFSKMWASYRGGNVLEKPPRLKALLGRPGDLPTLAQFDQVVEEWILEVFNHSEVEAKDIPKGMTRMQAWNEFLPETGKRTAREDDLILLCMRTSKPLKVGRNGITMWGREFYAEELWGIRGHKVYARHDTAEPGHLWVFDLEDRYICEAICRELVDYEATGEDIKAGEADKRRELALSKSYRDMLDARDIDPDPLHRHIERRRAANASLPPDDGRGQVIRLMELEEPEAVAAVGGGHRPSRIVPSASQSNVTDADIARGMEVLRLNLAGRLSETT